jgi:hypothetical protein
MAGVEMTIHLDDEELAAVSALAEADGTEMHEVVRAAVVAYLDTREHRRLVAEAAQEVLDVSR